MKIHYEPHEREDERDHEALLHSRIRMVQMNSGRSRMITHEYDAVKAVLMSKIVVNNVCANDDLLFKAVFDKTARAFRSGWNNLGEQLFSCASWRLDQTFQMLNCHEFTPEVELIRKHINIKVPYGLESLFGEEAVETVDCLNEAVEHLRQEGRSEEFLNQVDEFQRTAVNDYVKMMRFLTASFAGKEQIMMIRLDVSYGQYGPWKPKGHLISSMRVDQACFLAYLHQKYKNEFIGLASKLIYGKWNGINNHILILLKRTSREQGVTTARSLEDYWNKELSDVEGYCVQSNARQKIYRSCTMGVKQYSDDDLTDIFDMVAREFTSPDKFAKLILPNNSKTLFITEFNDIPAKEQDFNETQLPLTSEATI